MTSHAAVLGRTESRLLAATVALVLAGAAGSAHAQASADVNSTGGIEEVVAAEADIDDWAVVNAMGDGDVGRALRETALRFDRGDSPHQLVGQIRWWVSQQLAKGAPERVKAAVDALLRTDLALKSSGDSQMLVERLVVELTGRPVPRPQWGPGRR